MLNNFFSRHGLISLQFYQKQKSTFGTMETKPWEIWLITVQLRPAHLKVSESLKIEQVLVEKMQQIVDNVHKPHNFYLPETPNKNDLSLVYDCSYGNIHPYNFELSVTTSNNATDLSKSTFVGKMKKLLKDLSNS